MYPIHIKFVYLLSYTRKNCSYRNIHQPYMRNKLFLSDFNGSLSKIVYPSQPNWSTYEPYRMTINSLHHENDHQWNKNFKLNPSVTFFFFSCAFLLILFFLFYTVIQMNVKQRLSSKVSKEISICSMYFSVNLLFWPTIVTLLKRIFDLTLVNSKYVGITMFKQETRIYSYRKPHEI